MQKALPFVVILLHAQKEESRKTGTVAT